MSQARKLYVKSFGCQMNVYDSRRMADTLAPHGYVETDAPDDADLIILNTCHIREKAAEKVYSELGRMRVLKEAGKTEGRDVRIAVAGCVAQAEGAEIIRRAPTVDIVVGSQNYHRLPDLLARAADLPAFHTAFIETPAPSNPLGVKGGSESGTIGAPAAIGNAVIDALWHLRGRDIAPPLTPETVWRAIKEQRRMRTT